MERVALAALDPEALDDNSIRYRLAEPLGTTHVALNRYRIAAGSGFPGGLHAHLDQEEVFVVLEGTATFETLAGEVVVDAGEAVRFAPGEFQSGYNAGGDDLVVLALGAPRESEDVRIPAPCPTCDFDSLRLDTASGGVSFCCPDCGEVWTPAACPECGSGDLGFTIDGAAEPIVACGDCGATYDQPPLRE